MLYPLITDKNYHIDDLNESCLGLKPPQNLSYLMNLIIFHQVIIIPQKISVPNTMILISYNP